MSKDTFRYCLNTATIRAQSATILDQIEIAQKAGYDAIEPWIVALEEYQAAGGSLKDLRKRLADAGLVVPSAIGFARWLADQSDRRAAGLEQAKRDMDLVRQIGGTAIAAPPMGMTHRTKLDPHVAAERYRDLLEVGREMGVTPLLELWGFSSCLNRLGEVLMIAVETGHPDAAVLLDVYHIYKGGSSFAGLKLMGSETCRILHMNDYPGKPTREKITDADRVYPGDGVAPLDYILGCFKSAGFHGYFSLELFNQDYYKRPALEVARTGLRKMQAAVRKAKPVF